MSIWNSKFFSSAATALAVFSPVGRCPVCLSATTGIAGSVGLGVLASKAWFLPLIGALLLVGIAGSVRSARAHRRWQGAGATITGAVLLIAGRVLANTTLLWISVGLLLTGWAIDLYWKRKLSRIQLVQIRPL